MKFQKPNQKIIEFNLHHHDCFDTRFSQKFPEVRIRDRIISTHTKGDKTKETDMSLIKADKQSQLENYLSCLRKERMIKKVILLEKGKTFAKAIIESSRKVKNSLKNLLNNYQVIPKKPVTVNKGLEKYSVICSKDNIKLFIEGLERKGVIEKIKIMGWNRKQDQIQFTPAEKHAFITAMNYGYYTWPRKITLQELGDKTGLSRRGFQDNLRKAESKIMQKMYRHMSRNQLKE